MRSTNIVRSAIRDEDEERAYKFGQALRDALEAWDSNKRVAIIASGGLSHTVIEEDLDHRIMDGLKHNDTEKLLDYPDVRFRAGMANSSNRDLAVLTWTQEETSPFYCIEPWMGPPNSPETKIGLHSVVPGQTQKFYVEITLG